MRITSWFGAAVLLVSALSLAAQQAGVSAQESASAGSHVNENANTAAGVHPGSANGAAIGSASTGHAAASAASSSRVAYSAENMRNVSGELEGKLDSKTAKVGEPVVLKTMGKMKTADGTVIPKGTRLLGHVTEVQAHDRAHAESELGLAFDRAELKNGQSFAIQSMIRSVGPSASALAAEQMASDDALDTPMGGGAMSGGGRAAGGGRLIGGAPLAGAANTVGSTTAQAGAGLTGTADSTLHTAGGVAGNAMGDVGAGTHVVSSAGGGLVAHATGVPGVMLESGVSDSTSGVLSASRRNVHLDSGTQMEVGIVTTARQ
ncbi:MAG TPA: hypothetical protein VHD85_12680 [Terracidiphilus sp.]|nr:hypothetical protein [Terracidiphilus sp.]